MKAPADDAPHTHMTWTQLAVMYSFSSCSSAQTDPMGRVIAAKRTEEIKQKKKYFRFGFTEKMALVSNFPNMIIEDLNTQDMFSQPITNATTNSI